MAIFVYTNYQRHVLLYKLLLMLMMLQSLISVSFNSSIFQAIMPKVALMALVTKVLCAVALVHTEISDGRAYFSASCVRFFSNFFFV